MALLLAKIAKIIFAGDSADQFSLLTHGSRARATLSLDAKLSELKQRPFYTTSRASWFSIVSATHLDFNASIVVTRPFISYGFYRRRCCRCGNIPNDVQPPSDGCDDKSSESIATQAARWRVPSGRFSRLDSDSIDRSACDNSHNRSRVFVLDHLQDVPGLVGIPEFWHKKKK